MVNNNSKYKGLVIVPQSPSTRMDSLRVHNALQNTNTNKCRYLVAGGDNERFSVIAPMLHYNGMDSDRIEEIKGPGSYAEIFKEALPYLENFENIASSTNYLAQQRFANLFYWANESGLVPSNAKFNKISASNSEYLVNPSMVAIEAAGLVRDMRFFRNYDFKNGLEEKLKTPRKKTKKGEDPRDIAG